MQFFLLISMTIKFINLIIQLLNSCHVCFVLCFKRRKRCLCWFILWLTFPKLSDLKFLVLNKFLILLLFYLEIFALVCERILLLHSKLINLALIRSYLQFLLFNGCFAVIKFLLELFFNDPYHILRSGVDLLRTIVGWFNHSQFLI